MLWYGQVLFGLVLNGMVLGYCLDVVPCQNNCVIANCKLFGQIWYGLVWLGLVWFGYELYGAWVLYKCSSMQNVELLA